MKNTLIAILILLPAIVLGPMMKLNKHQSKQPPEIGLIDAALVFQRLAKSAQFTPLGSFAAANQGPYKITGYRHNSCDGTIALMPLFRNAEGASILRRLLRSKNIRSGVILSGKIYPNFPQLTYTVLQIKQSLNRLIKHSPSQQPLLAFAESGSCKLAEKMINSTLT